ncbi:MAG: carboxy-S-adenosyl-L-methionine synthase CmoA [Spirochaetales bacterium]|nr:carboxy-S-adenosyl-L-methionine synthase CmoA [Spirochaetales bacterium]
MSRKDKVFDSTDPVIRAFEFNENVAHVFDDMAERSIPHYKDVQEMVTTLALTFYQEGSRIYDLGCSTGTTIALLLEGLKEHGLEDYFIRGIDNSAPMCREAQDKLLKLEYDRKRVVIEEADIMDESIENASVVIMNYTLQFIDPFHREELIRKIYKGLNHNGILLVSDKTLQSHTDISRIFVDNYYNMKRRNGYSELEIARKREALENVLIPYPISEEEELFRLCGFEAVDLFYTWYNFSSFICLKKG